VGAEPAMQLWQMDVMGRVHLAGGVEVNVVTGIDDHSRFVVCAKAVMRATAQPVCLALAEALRRHGVPEQILTDNGKVFTARFGTGPGPVLFDRICADNGIKHLTAKPYSPPTMGKAARPAGRCGRSSSGPRTASTRRWPSCRQPWTGG
jgi:transposase InsO family protein